MRHAAGGLFADHLRWLQPLSAIGQRRGLRSPRPWLGRLAIEEPLQIQPVVGMERDYLMTTKSSGLYRQMGYRNATPYQLMVLRR